MADTDTMQTNHIATQLADAQFRLESARRAYANAQSRAGRLAAAEDIEFWGNKTAFLANSQRIEEARSSDAEVAS